MADDAGLSALAAFGLPGAGRVEGLPAAVNDLLAAASRHKLVGVLAAAVAEGGLTLSDDEVAQVARAHDAAMRESLLLEEMLLDAVAVLDTAGVDHRVLKGSALAHTVHADPAERSYGDNDVLLASDAIDRGVAALCEAGAVRLVPPLSATYDRRFAKSVTLRWHGPSELDVHRTLAAGPFGHLIRLDDLFREPVDLALAGRTVRTIPPELHLLHGAIHVALGDVELRLGNVRDLALLAADPTIDVERAVATAHAWQCAAPVAVGLRSTARLGHTLSPIEEWAGDASISDRDERRLAAYAQRSGRFRRQSLASWRVLPWRDRPAFTRAVVAPSAANREARGLVRRIRLPGRRAD